MPKRPVFPSPRTGDLLLRPTGLMAFGRHMPCSWGRGGIVAEGAKREGDGATPTGVHRLVSMLYRPDRIAPPATWARPIGLTDLWSDDPRDPAYNCQVRAPHGFSHESLRRADPLYDLILVTDWNHDRPVPGRGSAIFIHRWRQPGAPTDGCIALASEELLWLSRRVRPGARLIVPASFPLPKAV